MAQVGRPINKLHQEDVRKKIQEDYPHLRGELYEARQKHQAKVKEELGYKVEM